MSPHDLMRHDDGSHEGCGSVVIALKALPNRLSPNIRPVAAVTANNPPFEGETIMAKKKAAKKVAKKVAKKAAKKSAKKKAD